MHRSILCAALLALTAFARLSAQAPADQSASPASAAGPLRVFLDCNSGCDFDFFRTDLPAVSWVRDRAEADVHVLVVNEATGAGGRQYTLAFLGLGRFDGRGDTLAYSSPPAAVQDEVRRGLAQALKVGLVPFVASASGYDAVTIGFKVHAPNVRTRHRDPWNSWVFGTSLDGHLNGDKTSRQLSTNGQLSANRITDHWKTRLSLNGSYGDSRYDLSDGTNFATIQRNYSVNVLQVKSLGAHLSAGLIAGVGSSTYANQKQQLKLAPAAEYNVFPYSESTRRQITFQYAAGVARYRYEDTTIYGKIRETIAVHSLRADASARQPWGSLGMRALYRAQITDPGVRRLSLGGNLNVRVVRGLSVYASGNVSNIRDQIYLPREAATDEEILVHQRERATSYSYYMNFGVSYTFGSIFNNIVNSRFDSIDFF